MNRQSSVVKRLLQHREKCRQEAITTQGEVASGDYYNTGRSGVRRQEDIATQGKVASGGYYKTGRSEIEGLFATQGEVECQEAIIEEVNGDIKQHLQTPRDAQSSSNNMRAQSRRYIG